MSTSTTSTPVNKEPTNSSPPFTSLSSTFEPLSSTDILERVPSSVVRLAAALAPFIHALNRLLSLATWTGGKNSNSGSMLLLVSFWLVCAFGYELLRYAPQALILAWIAYARVRRQLAFAKPRQHSSVMLLHKQDLVSAATLNATLLELCQLADFFSSLRRNLLVPAVQLLSWDPSPMSTKAVAAFLIFTWPIWLLAFLPLRESGFPSLVLPVSGAAILASVSSWAVFFWHLFLRLVGERNVATFYSKAAPIYIQYDRFSHLLAKTPLAIIYSHLAALASRVRWEQWTDFKLTLLPPYPIGALTVRSLVCFVGTLALTWCSPWCALFRQAVWKSATIRRLVRGTGRLLSGQSAPGDAYGKANLHDEWAHGLYHQDGSPLPSAASLNPAAAGKKVDAKAKSAKENEEKVVRHQDVIYQFSIFENQRWWVGLDWTAALLPQERPSWSDESNNPVSPPSSFSLPATKILLNPSPTPQEAKAFTRRTIKWHWLDAEWSIAGVSCRGCYPSSTVYRASAKETATKPTNAVGDKDALTGAKQGYLGDALNRIRARTSGGAGPEKLAEEDSVVADVATTAHRCGKEEREEEWDVDRDGWQYGDNAWEKMSKKSRMGRYTRRRKWVRRAVLVELVQYGIHRPTPASPLSSSSGNAVEGEQEEAKLQLGNVTSDESNLDLVHSAVIAEVDDDLVIAAVRREGEQGEAA